MTTLTLRIPDDKAERLRSLAKHKGVSVNKLFEEFSNCAVAEFDTEIRFKELARRGNPEAGLTLIQKLDRSFQKNKV
ncbi:MAG: toxin-antitoxin system HicB family antitoxin [Kiritimatiellia bacterium]